MIRLFDAFFSFAGLVLLSPLLLLLALVGLFDTGLPLFRQLRVGRHRRPFTLVKFRTMRMGTQSVATHIVDSGAVTRFGAVLRRLKLDELPQLWNVLIGDMSLVGPRPCLESQMELVEAREKHGVFEVRPGITGLAQIRGVDMSTPELLAEVDSEMLSSLSVHNYFRYIFMTLLGEGEGDRIRK